jgi:rubrerythrin
MKDKVCKGSYDHRWSFDSGKWVCKDCGKTAKSTDAHIEPCLHCGAPADADQPYCEKCQQ